MSKQLPSQPSLEHLKNEAKAVLRAEKALNPSAKLAEAQLKIAREYGFASWSKLKRAVEGFATDRDAFFAAIRAGDRERVAQVLDVNPALIYANDPNSFGSPPLVVASHRNDRPLLDLLLKRGAEIDARSDWWAGSFGALDFSDDESSEFLLRRGATLTPHAAARLGKAAELREILARDPQAVHERGGDGQYPLHFARTPEIVDILVDAGADLEARDLDHCGTAAQTRVLDEEVLSRLAARGAEKDIFSAIVLGDLEFVREQIERDPDARDRRTDQPGNPMVPHAPGWHIYTYNLGFVRPFQVAIDHEQWAILDLLNEGASPRLQFLAACWKGESVGRAQDFELAQIDRDMLFDAAKKRRPAALKAMLGSGFDVQAADGQKFGCIHWAAFHGWDDLIEVILPFGPDLESRNVYGGTVLGTLMYGSINSSTRGGNYGRSAELLLNAGAKPPERIGGSPAVAEVLRRHGVKTD